jgi:hypothetical protein
MTPTSVRHDPAGPHLLSPSMTWHATTQVYAEAVARVRTATQ